MIGCRKVEFGYRPVGRWQKVEQDHATGAACPTNGSPQHHIVDRRHPINLAINGGGKHLLVDLEMQIRAVNRTSNPCHHAGSLPRLGQPGQQRPDTLK